MKAHLMIKNMIQALPITVRILSRTVYRPSSPDPRPEELALRRTDLVRTGVFEAQQPRLSQHAFACLAARHAKVYKQPVIHPGRMWHLNWMGKNSLAFVGHYLPPHFLSIKRFV
jgi:hypothetical protein